MKFRIFVSREIKPDLMSRLIMWKFKADYSHIGMIVEDGETDPFIWHSVGKGFSTASLPHFMQDHTIESVDITEYIKDKNYALGYLQGRIGVEYSQSQYLGFILPWTRWLVRNKEGKGICSEEVARFLYHCCKHHVHVDPNKFDFVSPKDVWETLIYEVADK